MKIGYLSDLHLEFRDTPFTVRAMNMINDCDADHIVIAGDIHSNNMFRDYFLGEIEKPLTYVLGNHDYYGSEWSDDFFESDLFVGGSLWTDFDNDVNVEKYSSSFINDFRFIKNWNVNKVKEIRRDHEKRIFESDKELVVTHFCPSWKSLDTSRFRFDDPLNGYFMNDLDDRILNSNKKLWIHGHTHSPADYMIGDCRVVCNPWGYPGENGPDSTLEIKFVEI